MPIPVIGLHNEDKVFVNGSCVLNEERFMLIGSFVAFFIPLVIMVVTYCLTIQVTVSAGRLYHTNTSLFISYSRFFPLPQVLQRQATVFLYEAKTSSQQPLHTPALTNTLRPPSATFSVPQINTIAPSDSQGRFCTFEPSKTKKKGPSRLKSCPIRGQNCCPGDPRHTEMSRRRVSPGHLTVRSSFPWKRKRKTSTSEALAARLLL